MSAAADRVGGIFKCPYCGQKIGARQDDGSVVHHDYRTRIRLIVGRLELDCQRCRAKVELCAPAEAVA